MKEQRLLAKATRRNWEIDASLFISAILASLSGVYFLCFVSGGYQGGRNPQYGVIFLFERHTWDLIHTWTGIAMILAALVHIVIHWKWVLSTLSRVWKDITRQQPPLNRHARFNIFINAMIGINFLVAAISGVYFVFFPGGAGSIDPGLIFSSSTWDVIHTWSGVLMIVAALLHFVIHWRWAVNVTERYFMRKKKTAQTEMVLQPLDNGQTH